MLNISINIEQNDCKHLLWESVTEKNKAVSLADTNQWEEMPCHIIISASLKKSGMGENSALRDIIFDINKATEIAIIIFIKQ